MYVGMRLYTSRQMPPHTETAWHKVISNFNMCSSKTHINFYLNFYMYVAHYVFYVACILRGCDMSTGFYTNMDCCIGHTMTRDLLQVANLVVHTRILHNYRR